MSGHDEIFSPRVGESGLTWGAACGVMAAIVAGGAYAGQLQWTCIGLITAFAFWQGVVRYAAVAREIAYDRRECQTERDALADTDVDERDDVLSIPANEDASVLKLVRLVGSSSGRMTKGEASEAFFEAFDAAWDERLGPLKDAAEQAPVLGLAGSLLGIVEALSALAAAKADNTALFEGMSTMALTTLAGGVAYVVVSGLHRSASNQVSAHRSDLVFVARNLLGGGPVPAAAATADNPFEI